MASESSLGLLRTRRFLPFFFTQFLGAFNDNVFKTALLLLFAARLGDTEAALMSNVAGGLFILPFFLFSATAGQLADKYEKSTLIRWVKLWEIVIMAAGALAFLAGSLYALIALLMLMGTQSAFFGPVKYGILPQHLRETELVAGNGLVEMGTSLAILLGIIAAGLLIGLGEAGIPGVAAVVVIAAVLGYLASRAVPVAPAVAPELRINWNPITETWRTYRFTRGNRTVYLSILGVSWFWFLGATYITQLPVYTETVLHAGPSVVTLLLTVLSVGIALGSMLCDRMSGHKVELGLVPFGSIGLTVFGIDLYFAAPAAAAAGDPIGVAAFLSQGSRVLADLFAIGVFSGFYIVPLYALIQQRSEPSHRSRIIAGNNILNAGFMVLSALFAIVALGPLGRSIPELFLAIAVLNAVVAVYIYTLVPEFLMRFIVWMAIHTLYRVRKRGLEHIPEEGPAVLVCNHVSFVDALVLAGSIRRPVRFVMDHRIFKIPVLSFVFRTAKAIPIAPAKEDAELMERAFDRISEELRAGEVVCIFPEGKITATGEMNPFRAGIERIIARDPVPVVPIALQGLWGSFFSRKGGAAFVKFPRRLWSRIGLEVGAPVPPEAASAPALQLRVAELRGEHL